MLRLQRRSAESVLGIVALLSVSGVLTTAGTASADTVSVTVENVTVRKDGHSTKVSISGPQVVPLAATVVCEGSAAIISVQTPLGPIHHSASKDDSPSDGHCSDPVRLTFGRR